LGHANIVGAPLSIVILSQMSKIVENKDFYKSDYGIQIFGFQYSIKKADVHEDTSTLR